MDQTKRQRSYGLLPEIFYSPDERRVPSFPLLSPLTNTATAIVLIIVVVAAEVEDSRPAYEDSSVGFMENRRGDTVPW